jgi:hypothetical protein
MPFEGFICEVTQEVVAPAYCLACAREGAPGCPVTAPVVKGILDGLRSDDFGLTVTSLLGCARKERLKQEWPYFLKPSESWWAYRGMLMHGVAYDYARQDGDAIAEARFSMLVDAPGGGTMAISGQPDLVLVDRFHLVDFKTTMRTPRPWLTFTCPETRGRSSEKGSGRPAARRSPTPTARRASIPRTGSSKKGHPGRTAGMSNKSASTGSCWPRTGSK